MSLGVRREVMPVEIPQGIYCEKSSYNLGTANGTMRPTKSVNAMTGFGPKSLPQKVMAISYFAQTKGVVGCQYTHCLAFKVRDLMWFQIELYECSYDP
jgi:hypothetical protein